MTFWPSQTTTLERFRRKLQKLFQPLDESPQYDRMLLKAAKMPMIWNIVAGISTWMVLGGFLLVLAAFPKIQRSEALKAFLGDNIVYHAVQSVSALVLAIIMLVVGAAGVLVLGLCQRENVIWSVDRLF